MTGTTETLKPNGTASIQERISCAAIWYKELPVGDWIEYAIESGIVVKGHRHADIIHTVYNLLGKRTCTNGADCTGEHEQGFVTNKGRFVDRKEAMLIARAAGQLINVYATDTLYSEDLY